MKLKFLCCEVFFRLACLAAARTGHTVDMEFTPLGAHESPETLRAALQEEIDRASEKKEYDAIILGYGLCGNSTAGLKARSVPLVIPRAHDCCTIFLGSRKRFLEYFGENLSSEWGAAGYMERNNGYLRETDTGKLLGLDKEYEELVEKYGSENAEYIWETMHPAGHEGDLTYIEVPETAGLGYQERFEAFAAEQGKAVRVLEGDMGLLRGLADGDWSGDEYLVVKPGQEIKGVYDHDVILDCE